MVCVKLIPRMLTLCFEESELTVSSLLGKLGDYLDDGEIIVVVNGRIVNDYEVTVTERDEVVVVQAFMGGFTWVAIHGRSIYSLP